MARIAEQPPARRGLLFAVPMAQYIPTGSPPVVYLTSPYEPFP